MCNSTRCKFTAVPSLINGCDHTLTTYCKADKRVSPIHVIAGSPRLLLACQHSYHATELVTAAAEQAQALSVQELLQRMKGSKQQHRGSSSNDSGSTKRGDRAAAMMMTAAAVAPPSAAAGGCPVDHSRTAGRTGAAAAAKEIAACRA